MWLNDVGFGKHDMVQRTYQYSEYWNDTEIFCECEKITKDTLKHFDGVAVQNELNNIQEIINSDAFIKFCVHDKLSPLQNS